MDIPDLVQQALGDEEIEAGVSLGDEDAVCLTPTRTLVYNGEGLISDEQVAEYSHEIEQLSVKEGRRKTKFVLQYIDGTKSFSVPSNRGDKVLELLLEGVLRLERVIEPRESLVGVYRFSELTLIIAEGRLIKLIGNQAWNEDFEVYDYDAVTGLEFERASVATSIVLAIDGRPQRIKVPNDTAPIVRQTLEKALFGFYDVASLDEFNRIVDDGTEDAGDANAADDGGDLDFGSGIDPLVTDHDEDSTDVPTDDPFTAEAGEAQPSSEPTADQDVGGGDVGGGDGSNSAEGGTATQENSAASTSHDTPGSSHDTLSESGRGTSETNSPTETSSPAQGNSTVDSSNTREINTTQEPSPKSRANTTADTSAESPDTSVSADESVSSDTTARSESNGQSKTTGEQAPTKDTTAESATDQSVASDDASLAADPSTAAVADDAVSQEELDAVTDRLDELTDAVDRQNQLLKRQHKAIKQLVSELQSE